MSGHCVEDTDRDTGYAITRRPGYKSRLNLVLFPAMKVTKATRKTPVSLSVRFQAVCRAPLHR
jgi:hypothetical protein